MATKGRKKRTTTKRTPEGAAPSIDAADAADGVMVVSLVPSSGPLFRVEGPLSDEEAAAVGAPSPSIDDDGESGAWFVSTFLLRPSPEFRKAVGKRRWCRQQLRNVVVDHGRKTLSACRSDPRWQACLAEMAEEDEERLERAKRLEAGEKVKARWTKRQLETRASKRRQIFNAVKKEKGFNQFAFQKVAQAHAKASGTIAAHLDANSVQECSDRVWKGFDQHLKGKRGVPRFRRLSDVRSMEGKSPKQGLRAVFDGRRLWCVWCGIKAMAEIDLSDPKVAHALSCAFKRARILFRTVNGKESMYLQIVHEGRPLRKRPAGTGTVGFDLGVSTTAIVARNVDPETIGLDYLSCPTREELAAALETDDWIASDVVICRVRRPDGNNDTQPTFVADRADALVNGWETVDRHYRKGFPLPKPKAAPYLPPGAAVMREDDGVHVAVASLQAISASVKDLQAEKRRIQRKLDRCDRSANGGYDTEDDIRREEASAAAEGRTLPPRCYEPTRYETGPGGRRIRKLGKRIPEADCGISRRSGTAWRPASQRSTGARPPRGRPSGGGSPTGRTPWAPTTSARTCR
ncbi:MAG: hypothetical protein LBR22_11315 [Desulfovibrio sp.]|jgi:hypothetical protein|nr:hypothetical protein [Desulfovibrio sp.]